MTPWLRPTITQQPPLLQLSFLPIPSALTAAPISPFAFPALTASPVQTRTSPSVSVQLHNTISDAVEPAIAAILYRHVLLLQLWRAASAETCSRLPRTFPSFLASLRLLLIIRPTPTAATAAAPPLMLLLLP
jgi:hypothetical protein